MEWNGMEWNGMEWNGMEWNRVIPGGAERSETEPNGAETEAEPTPIQFLIYICYILEYLFNTRK